MTAKGPTELVRAYAKEAAPLHSRGDRGPEQLPSGEAILALDDEGRAQAVVAAYAALPRGKPFKDGDYGKLIMLGLLITHLLRKRLPLRDRDLETMAEGAARSHGPAWGPCDYDAALLKELKGHERLSPRVRVALRELAARRGTSCALDRRIHDKCLALAE